MFSKGQTVFAILFAISFIAIIIYMYIKDKKIHKEQYKGVKWIVLGFLLFILFLFLIKGFIKE
ncbi:hypothetical protein [Flavobacterium sp.]|jgi:hypothetical protein|uniref:hypothetical protein n=1 Tax=Flavobacterium sp. TaxID=239 RepID=UPI0037C15A66